MVSQATKIFSKCLSHTDVKKRLAIPAKIMPCLPNFNGSYAFKIHITYGTRTWPIAYTIRKKGYKKPVFSGGLWRNFVTRNDLNVGDRITMYKVGTSSHYRVEVEKPVEIESGTSLMMLADVATDTSVDHVLAKPSMIRIFGTNMSDNEEAHLKTETKCFTKEITGDATEESCRRLSLDMLPVHTPYVGVLNLDLTLAQPILDGVIVEGSEQEYVQAGSFRDAVLKF